MDKFAATIPLAEALGVVEAALAGRRLPAEALPVARAVGRTLAQDAVSRLDLPPFDKSAMDGYAVLPDDSRDEYRLLEVVPAGSVPRRGLEPGTTVKVMTGSAVPRGAGRVIRIEHTRADGDAIHVIRHGDEPNICPRGEDVRRGDVILPGGTVLGPAELANLASCGLSEVRVARAVHLAIVSTGDEVVSSPEQLGPGKILDANGPLLAALGERFAMEVVSRDLLPDEPAATVAGLRRALDAADIVVLTGGVSVGDFDFVLDSFAEAGLTLHFSRVAIHPGKPTTFATGPDKVAFGLPGNPVSTFLMFHLFVLHAASILSGARPGLREVRLPLGFDFRRRKTERRGFVPCRLGPDGRVHEIEYHGSAHLMALIGADAFLVVPEGTGEIGEGCEAAVALIPGGWR